MALDQIILVSNPGSESRKYGLYKGNKCLLQLHFEKIGKRRIICNVDGQVIPVNISHVAFAPTELVRIMKKVRPELSSKPIAGVALRIVAPTTFFQRNHVLTNAVIKRLERLQAVAPLHVSGTISEYRLLKNVLPKAMFYGISDSAFMATKPDVALYYGIPLDTAEKLDIKRFGYHGLSLSSVVSQLKRAKKMPQRMIVCHLGGGVSIAAIKNGIVVDSSMGYSPLEGVMMASRSGSVDLLAYDVIKNKLKLTNDSAYDYFNARSGLLGVSGFSSDIRDLISHETSNKRAKLALDMYVYKIQQAIGAMTASMNGSDALVLTGTVGLRSSAIRRRIVERLLFLGYILDSARNNHPDFIDGIADISQINNPAHIFVLETDESNSMIQQVKKML